VYGRVDGVGECHLNFSGSNDVAMLIKFRQSKPKWQ